MAPGFDDAIEFDDKMGCRFLTKFNEDFSTDGSNAIGSRKIQCQGSLATWLNQFGVQRLHHTTTIRMH